MGLFRSIYFLIFDIILTLRTFTFLFLESLRLSSGRWIHDVMDRRVARSTLNYVHYDWHYKGKYDGATGITTRYEEIRSVISARTPIGQGPAELFDNLQNLDGALAHGR